MSSKEWPDEKIVAFELGLAMNVTMIEMFLWMDGIIVQRNDEHFFLAAIVLPFDPELGLSWEWQQKHSTVWSEIDRFLELTNKLNMSHPQTLSINATRADILTVRCDCSFSSGWQILSTVTLNIIKCIGETERHHPLDVGEDRWLRMPVHRIHRGWEQFVEAVVVLMFLKLKGTHWEILRTTSQRSCAYTVREGGEEVGCLHFFRSAENFSSKTKRDDGLSKQRRKSLLEVLLHLVDNIDFQKLVLWSKLGERVLFVSFDIPIDAQKDLSIDFHNDKRRSLVVWICDNWDIVQSYFHNEEDDLPSPWKNIFPNRRNNRSRIFAHDLIAFLDIAPRRKSRLKDDSDNNVQG